MLQTNKTNKIFNLRSLLALIIIAICISAVFNIKAFLATADITAYKNTVIEDGQLNTAEGTNTSDSGSPNNTGSSTEAGQVNPVKSPALKESTHTAAASSSSKVQKSAVTGGALKTVLTEKNINASTAKFSILIDKTDHVLTLLANGTPIKSYHVELGDNGLGDKEISGDHKTPEGTFYICEKSVLSPADQYLGTRWMRLSYPSIEDAQRGLSQGLIGHETYDSIVAANNNGTIPPQHTALDGGVGIHGGSTSALGKDWTYGCTGLSNKDAEEIYPYIKIGTKVVIQK